MGEIRFVGTGETRGYPYLVCKKNRMYHRSPMQTEKSQPEGKQIMLETRFTEFLHYPLTQGSRFLGLHQRPMIDYFSYLLLEKSKL